ncbi:MAG: SpoIIE family protein phosphatase [Ruminococcus sp.]|nr:SpoIIE family protein phosphatase [Ruminococcus sp.]
MWDKIKSYFKVYESEETKAVFEQNEYAANRLAVMVEVACACILAASWLLNLAGIFTISSHIMNVLAIQGFIELAVPIALYIVFKGRKRWLKYVLVISLLLVCTRLFSVLNHNVILIMVLPVLLSGRYFSKGFTVIVSILSVLMLAAASLSTVFYGVLDLNFFPSPADGVTVVFKDGLRATLIALGFDTSAAEARIMLHGFLPRLLVFTIIAFISVFIAKHGHHMVLEQAKISSESANAKAELNTANQIQNSMVPTVFPPFPDRKEFDVYASMVTAKEVGGDFYDFFMVDDDHLALVIADVSGKGVPAALYMMATKILISDRTLMGGSPAEILSFVNKRICKKNTAEMFVTVWLGILNLKTGKIIASNAGHEYPAVCRNGGEYEVLKDNHSFVVGGYESTRYKNYEFSLKKGDTLFLYTDGIPEATNSAEEQFGMDRMVDSLNNDSSASPEEILSNIKNDVEGFVNGAVRFDDYTMLCLRYNGEDISDGAE